MNKKNLIYGGVICIAICLLAILTSFLTLTSFEQSYVSQKAENNTVILESVKDEIEFSLKYGKTMENYYGISELFEKLNSYCNYYDNAFLCDMDQNILYQDQRTEYELQFSDEFQTGMTEVKEGIQTQFLAGDYQYIIIPVKNQNDVIVAGLGLAYHTGAFEEDVNIYVRQIYGRAFFSALIGITLFLILYRFVKHEFQYGKLLKLSLFAIIFSMIIFGMLNYSVFYNGYTGIAEDTAQFYLTKEKDDIEHVIRQGIWYEEIQGLEESFAQISEKSEMIASIEIIDTENIDTAKMNEKLENIQGETYSEELITDSNQGKRSMVLRIAPDYLPGRMKAIIISIFMTVVSACLIAAEVMIFVITAITIKQKKKRMIYKDKDISVTAVGNVRGISFFFSTFEYMATAFVSIVLTTIYQPIVIFNYTIPKSIVMALPLSIGILISMITSWMSGIIIPKTGWKVPAVLGNVIMIAGSFGAAMAVTPLTFIGAQVIIGTGLGLEKTAIDLFAVLSASEEEMEHYTAQANAGIMIGFSASSAIGAILAERFGYSGAYLAIGAIGIIVLILIIIYGQNIKQINPTEQGNNLLEAKDESKQELNNGSGGSKTIPALSRKTFADYFQFAGYLLLAIVPYFFIMMFVDYFFPVFANDAGISTEVIGYVFLIYGVATSYLGTYLCSIFTKKIGTLKLMCTLVVILGIGMAGFSLHSSFLMLIVVVMLIAIADGIMPSVQYKYVTLMEYTKKTGLEKTIGMEGVFSNGIRGFAPIIFGIVMMNGTRGIMAVSMIVILCTVAFFLLNRRKI